MSEFHPSWTAICALPGSDLFVILTKRATRSGWKDLGQLRVSEAGTGF